MSFAFPSHDVMHIRMDQRPSISVTSRPVQKMGSTSIYLSLAEMLSTRVVTADRRLYNALQGGPYGHLVLWVEDGP